MRRRVARGGGNGQAAGCRLFAAGQLRGDEGVARAGDAAAPVGRAVGAQHGQADDAEIRLGGGVA